MPQELLKTETIGAVTKNEYKTGEAFGRPVVKAEYIVDGKPYTEANLKSADFVKNHFSKERALEVSLNFATLEMQGKAMGAESSLKTVLRNFNSYDKESQKKIIDMSKNVEHADVIREAATNLPAKAFRDVLKAFSEKYPDKRNFGNILIDAKVYQMDKDPQNSDFRKNMMMVSNLAEGAEYPGDAEHEKAGLGDFAPGKQVKREIYSKYRSGIVAVDEKIKQAEKQAKILKAKTNQNQ